MQYRYSTRRSNVARQVACFLLPVFPYLLLDKYFHSFKNSLIIHKDKQKQLIFNEGLYISYKDTAKLYVQFFLDQNNPKFKS